MTALSRREALALSATAAVGAALPSVNKPRKRKITRQELGKRLRAARKQAGLTVADSAAKAGVSSDAIQAWEAGADEPTVTEAYNAATAYGVTVQALMA